MVGRGNACFLYLVMAVILQLFASTSGEDSNDGDEQKASFYSIEGASLTSNVTMVILATDELDCALSCLRSHHRQRRFSFNFGRKAERGLHARELSNSERALEPQSMQSRRAFHYFGMQIVYLTRFFPCLSSPCCNVGSCVNGPTVEMFSCRCPLEIKVLPYIDNKCNVNRSLIKTNDPVCGTFHAEVNGHKYKLNYFEAERLCQVLGASLASLHQLKAAWQARMQWCRNGWLSGCRAAYPMQKVKANCGNKIGIIGGDRVYEKNNTKWNAWCYKD